MRFIFDIFPLTVYIILQLMLQCLDHISEEFFILMAIKIFMSRYDDIISLILVPRQMFFRVGENIVSNQVCMYGDQRVH